LELFCRDFIWLDTGTHESLLEASVFVERVKGGRGSRSRASRKSRVEWDILTGADPLSGAAVAKKWI
jgi:dTDP-glucose pyrophosphorylase